MSYYSRNKLALSRCSARARTLVDAFNGSSEDLRKQAADTLGVSYTGKWPTRGAPMAMVVLEGRQGWICDEDMDTKRWGTLGPVTACFRLDPAPAPRTRKRWDGKVVKAKSSAHRLHVACPDCASWVPTGRLHQHVGTATCLRLAEADSASEGRGDLPERWVPSGVN